MGSQLDYLINKIKNRKIFKRNKKDVGLKVIAVLVYYLGFPPRRTSKVISLFPTKNKLRVCENIISQNEGIIKPPKKKNRGLIAVDETNGD